MARTGAVFKVGVVVVAALSFLVIVKQLAAGSGSGAGVRGAGPAHGHGRVVLASNSAPAFAADAASTRQVRRPGFPCTDNCRRLVWVVVSCFCGGASVCVHAA